MTKKSVSQYDPGKPQPATQTGPNTWSIDSFRSGGSYLVTLGERPSCTCRDFEIRGEARPCKHIASVKQQAAFVAAAERAARLTDAQLDFFLAHHQAKDNLIVAGAIRVVRAERRKQQAAVRPPIGTSVKIYGPNSESEAWATC